MSKHYGSIALVLIGLGCGQAASVVDSGFDEGKPLAQKWDFAHHVYPVDPDIHLSDPSLGPVQPGKIRASLPNAVAYARYGLRLFGGLNVASTTEVAVTVAESWAAWATATSVSPERAINYAMMVASDDQVQELTGLLYSEALGLTEEPKLTKVQRRMADQRAGFSACVNDGHTRHDCCVSLGYFAVLSRPDELLALTDSEVQSITYESWSSDRISSEHSAVIKGQKLAVQPFVHLGSKAWLAVCAPVFDDSPKTLDGLKMQYGDWAQDPSWASEFHPVSLAKLSGRRIYRRALGDGTRISVADSIGADCTIRETEIIIARPGEDARFLSYDSEGHLVPHGYFPAGKGRDIVKLTPDSCMGCHYTFDQREFSVVAPSFEALSLQLPVKSSVPQWRDDSHCTIPGEQVIRHNAPIREH